MSCTSEQQRRLNSSLPTGVPTKSAEPKLPRRLSVSKNAHACWSGNSCSGLLSNVLYYRLRICQKVNCSLINAYSRGVCIGTRLTIIYAYKLYTNHNIIIVKYLYYNDAATLIRYTSLLLHFIYIVLGIHATVVADQDKLLAV